ncbi:hypothetical protein GCM10011512_05360 [Tersicoccus solisilvae]|uniref:Uncharacterized protein n=1 Tax=Tersicoccus solisilvae TaxID=1882339 RepID=A0ABQ1NPR0_9MICC|nr:hypothetical protein [Tersicoccus solisilvae]GGC81581.1 hypothetical protein GCM10011512_05360 [Tersicoccus solisilvae]
MKRRSTSERRAAPLIPTGSLNRHTYRHVVELTEQVFTLLDGEEYDRLETLMHAVPTETRPMIPSQAPGGRFATIGESSSG